MKYGILIWVLSALILTGCGKKTTQRNTEISDAGCSLNLLETVVERVKIDSSKYLNNYLSEKDFNLTNCNLKKFRGNDSLKAPLVLFWLKIDNLYLQHHWDYNYSQEIASISPLAGQLVTEFYLLHYGKEPTISIEYFRPNWVNEIIKEDRSLLGNKQINQLYLANQQLRKRQKPETKSSSK